MDLHESLVTLAALREGTTRLLANKHYHLEGVLAMSYFEGAQEATEAALKVDSLEELTSYLLGLEPSITFA
jgi:hypothetical protein